MPWTASDALHFTKKATTLSLRRQWAKIANRILAHGQKESMAIKIANAAIKKLSSLR